MKGIDDAVHTKKDPPASLENMDEAFKAIASALWDGVESPPWFSDRYLSTDKPLSGKAVNGIKNAVLYHLERVRVR